MLEVMIITRRGLIGGLAAFIAAPAIVRASSLMPVKAWRFDGMLLEEAKTNCISEMDLDFVNGVCKIRGVSYPLSAVLKLSGNAYVDHGRGLYCGKGGEVAIRHAMP